MIKRIDGYLAIVILLFLSGIVYGSDGGGQMAPDLPPLPADPNQQQALPQPEFVMPDQQTTVQNNFANSDLVPLDDSMMEPPDASNSFGTVLDPAFQNIIKRQFPLTEEQIEALRQVFQDNQRATVAPLEVPTPTVSTQTVSLEPGSIPPAIRMATGYVSSVVFVDATGQPWPIANYSLGNPSAFNIQWDTSSHVLMIQGVNAYEFGNMAIRLVGLDTPVMLTMVSDQQLVDYRVDLRVQGNGPNAKPLLVGTGIPEQNNYLLSDLLEGVPPQGAQRLSISGGPAQAWLHNDTLYLRTPLTVLSPGWSATVSSADGTQVYEMNQVAPMILASQDGQPITLTVDDL